MRLARVIVLSLAAILVSQAGSAQTEPALTDGLIRSFIASFPDARAFGEQHRLDAVEGAADPAKEMANPFGAVMEHLRAKGLYGEFQSIVGRHGFSSPEQWTGIAGRVMKAYAANSLGQQNVEMNAQMQMALKQIQSNPNIPEAQKQAMLKQMQSSAALMKQLVDASPADKAAVRPHMAQLKETFEKQQ